MKRPLVKWRDILPKDLENPEFRAEWERTALARAVSLAVIGYRIEHGLSQRQLAKQLGMPQSVIGRLEIGEHTPSLETLYRLATGLSTQFVLAVAPPNQAGDLPLREGAKVLEDLTLSNGGRVVITAG